VNAALEWVMPVKNPRPAEYQTQLRTPESTQASLHRLLAFVERHLDSR
jgi:hypothetical protein